MRRKAINQPKWVRNIISMLKRRMYEWSCHTDIEVALRAAKAESFQRGKHEGIEECRYEMSTNVCYRHRVPISCETLQLANGILEEVWTCPYWQDHTTAPMPKVQPFPDVERITGSIPQPNPLQVVHHALRSGRGPHTAVQQAMRPTRNLDK